MERIEVSIGKNKAYTTTGALIGAGVGVLVGLLATNGAKDTCTGALLEFGCSYEEKRVAGVVVFGLAFAGLGAIIGNQAAPERWRDAAVDRIRLGFMRQRGGTGLALSASISF